MMEIHPGLMIWTIISFIVLLLILNKFAWKPILKALDAREQGIKSDIEQAKTAREEAQQALSAYQQQLAEAQSEAQRIIAKSRADAERVREELLAKSKAEAQTQVERARKQIETETQAAITTLRGEVANLALFTAEKVIGRTLTPEDHKRLAMEGLLESRN
ncbi:MAG: F0F1 ATP synthase subunit B [Calditrichaeota bacterium]|nr:F0F1 ATP synthase subunit B [Calditrichota bacterium]